MFPVLDQENVERKLVLGGNSPIQVLIRLLPGRALRNPPQALCDPPNVHVNGKFCAPETEHQNARRRLRTNALEPGQGSLRRLIVHVAHVLEAERRSISALAR
jgi:hypothetical protein